MFAPLQHETAHARAASAKGAGGSEERARVRGPLRHEASICCMFAFLQHETAHARAASAKETGGSAERARVRGPLAHRASICCIFAPLQHETAHARAASAKGSRRAARTGRGFEGRWLTRRSSAACSPSCNTRQRTHARRQPRGAGGSEERARVRGAVDSLGVHLLHVRPPATRDSARTRGVSHGSRRQRGAGAGSRAVASPGVHLLHVDKGGHPFLRCPLV